MRHAEFGKYKGASVKRTAALTLGNGAVVLVTFQAEEFDKGGLVDLGANPTRISIKETGVYGVGCQCAFATNGGGTRAALIRLNGVASNWIVSEQRPAAASGNSRLSLARDVKLAKGDYLELEVFQNSGGNLDLLAQADSPMLWASLRGWS